MISEQKLATLERLANEATEGPWECCESKDAEYAVLSGNIKKNAVGICYSPRKKDMRFCAAARETVPELIKTVRELEGIIKQMCSFCCGYLEMRCDKCPLQKGIEMPA